MKYKIHSFTFYDDYFALIDTISEKDKKEILCAIVDFMFKGIEPNLDGHNRAIFNTLSRQLNKSKNKSMNARKDNQEEEQNEINLKSNENQIDNQEEINKGKKTSVLSFKFYISSFKFIENNILLKNKVLEWLEYKKQKNKNYTEIGLNTLLKKIEEQSQKYGIEKVIALIDDSMANNYQGIIWEKLENKKTSKETLEEIAKKNKEARERVLGVFDE